MEEDLEGLPKWAVDAIAGFKRGAEINRKMSERALPVGLLIGLASGIAWFFISHGSWLMAVFEFVIGSIFVGFILRYGGRRGVRAAQGQIESTIALAHRKASPHPDATDDSFL